GAKHNLAVLAQQDKEAAERRRTAAELSDPDLLYQMGQDYMSGMGTFPRDEKEAAHFLGLAADRGHEGALALLQVLQDNQKRTLLQPMLQDKLKNVGSARMFDELVQNGKPIAEIKREAEASNDAGLQYMVALAHSEGRQSFPKDETEAARFFRLAADR